MADFRRWITALAVLALFAGLASAQVSTGAGGIVCNSVAQVTPQLRAEGITEMVGDIVITCSGGNYIAPGAAIPQVNVVVSLTAPVTSRLASTSSSASTGASEALLLIDEPNSGLTSPVDVFGPQAPQTVCPTPLTGCVEYAVQTTTVRAIPQLPSGSPLTVASNTATGTTAGYNVFQGLVNGNQVSFLGVPILPPVTAGLQRVFRITNIRVNASGAGASVVAGVQPIYAYISTSPSSALPISASAVTVGFVQTSLTPTVTNGTGTGTGLTSVKVNQFTQCTTPTSPNVALLNFTENFATAFKTRVAPLSTGAFTYTGTTGASYYTQNVPGVIYNSESGFILPVNGMSAGLANSGTRFQAVFNNLPSGATIYVSRYNVTAFGTIGPTTTANFGIPTDLGPAAVLTSGGASGGFAEASTTNAITIPTGVQAIPLSVSSTGSATAVWEVVNTNPNATETMSFGVYIAYTPSLTANLPTPGSASTVTLSYAPIGTGSLPANPNWIPRFIIGPASTAQPLLNIVQCQTILLFPYVTAQSGFDTGIAISNTSSDPLGTANTTGTCSLNFYGANAPTAAITVPNAQTVSFPTAAATSVASGGQVAFNASVIAPNFQGYMFASCTFQFAHGFAFVSDVGARNLAMGYLALIVNNGSQLNGRATTQTAESLAN